MPAKITFPSLSIKPLGMIAIIGTVLLTACGSTTKVSTAAATAAALAPAMKLAAGTLQLEGSEQAVDADSAAKLLPLWQLLDELSASSSAAPEEYTAVIEQIEATMAPAQITAINAMRLDQGQLARSSQSATSTSSAPAASAAQAASVTGSSGGPMMDMAAGGPPPDGGGGPTSGSSSRSSTSSSKTSAASGQLTLIKQVIRLLESKIQS